MDTGLRLVMDLLGVSLVLLEDILICQDIHLLHITHMVVIPIIHLVDLLMLVIPTVQDLLDQDQCPVLPVICQVCLLAVTTAPLRAVIMELLLQDLMEVILLIHQRVIQVLQVILQLLLLVIHLGLADLELLHPIQQQVTLLQLPLIRSRR